MANGILPRFETMDAFPRSSEGVFGVRMTFYVLLFTRGMHKKNMIQSLYLDPVVLTKKMEDGLFIPADNDFDGFI